MLVKFNGNIQFSEVFPFALTLIASMDVNQSPALILAQKKCATDNEHQNKTDTTFTFYTLFAVASFRIRSGHQCEHEVDCWHLCHLLAFPSHGKTALT